MNLNDIPWDDPETFKLLSRGETLGIFQVESPGMIGLLRSVRPTSLDDISAVLALYRPGPMDSGYHTEFARRKRSGEHRAHVHPELDDILTDVLSETYGVVAYQEQVMEMIARVTGWGYAEAEDIFTAMRKKKLDKMESSKPAFYRAAELLGFTQHAVDALWEVLVPFSDYSFNKSHSMGYAYLTYRGAYLKANHPTAYMTALLSSAKDAPETAKYVQETRRMKIPILGPDVNTSNLGFTKTEKGIRYGLTAIRGVGEAAAGLVVAGQPYNNIDQLFRRGHPKMLNSSVFSALVKSGALDSLWSSRTELLEQGPEIASVALEHRNSRRRGQRTLLNTRYRPQKASGQTEETADVRRGLEHEVLGTYLTWPKALLKLSRPLQPIEWKHVRDSLGYEQPTQEVSARIGKTTFKLPGMTTVTPQLANALRAVGIGVETE